MSVGAVNLDAALTGVFDRGSPFNAATMPGTDFAAVLLLAQGAKAEAARSISTAGDLRQTVIIYTDGTSDTQTSVAGDGRADEAAAASLSWIVTPALQPVRPVASAAPAEAFDADRDGRAARRMRPHWRAAGRSARDTAPAPSPALPGRCGVGSGRLIDLRV